MEQQELQREVQTLSEAAQELLRAANEPITTDFAFQGAAATLKTIKGNYKTLDDREKEITRPMNEALKAARALFAGPKSVLEQAEAALKRGIAGYTRAQEEKRLAEQRRLDEEAERERQRLARLQENAEKRGDTDKAAQFEERKISTVAPIARVETPKVSGVTMRKDYDFEIVDAAQLPREYLVPDEKKIRKVVKTLGVDTKIPGIRIIERDVVAARSA